MAVTLSNRTIAPALEGGFYGSVDFVITDASNTSFDFHIGGCSQRLEFQIETTTYDGATSIAPTLKTAPAVGLNFNTVQTMTTVTGTGTVKTTETTIVYGPVMQITTVVTGTNTTWSGTLHWAGA